MSFVRHVRHVVAFWRELAAAQRVLLAMLFVSLLLVLLIPLVGLIPFTPYRFYGYSVPPGGNEVCPLTPVRVFVERKTERPLFGSVKSIDVETSWKSSDGLITPVVKGTLPLSPHPRKKVPSRLLRSAPRIPGEWMIDSTFHIHGMVLGFERTQEMRWTSEPLITVLSPEDPRC